MRSEYNATWVLILVHFDCIGLWTITVNLDMLFQHLDIGDSGPVGRLEVPRSNDARYGGLQIKGDPARTVLLIHASADDDGPTGSAILSPRRSQRVRIACKEDDAPALLVSRWQSMPPYCIQFRYWPTPPTQPRQYTSVRG